MRNRTRVSRKRTGLPKRRSYPGKAKGKLFARRKASIKRKPAPVKLQPRVERQQPASGKLYDQGYDDGHTAGYREGFEAGGKQAAGQCAASYDEGREAGYSQGYDEGFCNGKHEGGDAIVDRMLPEYQILPETSMEEIVAAGIGVLQQRIVHLLTANQLGERIIAALDSRSPFSLVRLGDGESLTLAQETAMSVDQVRKEGRFLPYAGVNVPDLDTRDRVAEAVRRATVIGVPKLRQPNYQPLTFAVFRAHGIDYRSLALTDSLVNYYLYQAGYLPRITQGRRVLVIGNKAEGLADVLSANGVAVAGAIAPVHGVGDVARVLEASAAYEFDLALVSAGISAVLIAEHLASRMGKVAIDFGHMADSMVSGEAPYR